MFILILCLFIFICAFDIILLPIATNTPSTTTSVLHSTTTQTTYIIQTSKVATPLIPTSGTSSALNQLGSILIPGIISILLMLLVVLVIVSFVACFIKKRKNREQLMKKELPVERNPSLCK